VVVIDWVRPGGIRPGLPILLGLLLGIAGIVLLIGPGNLAGERAVNPIGALVLMGASMSWSIGSVYSRHAALPESPLMATAMEMLCGGVLLSLLGGATGEWSRLDLGAVSLRSILALAYLIVFGAIVAFSAYTWLLKVVPPARAATYAYVNPVVAVLLGWALADEPLTPRTMIATTIIIAAVVLITTFRLRAPTREDAATSVHEGEPKVTEGEP
jgi:drug/metabolite transporter (DMT)-like permease